MSSLSVKHTSTSDLLSQPGLSLSSPLPHPLLFQPYEPTEPFSTTDLYVDGVFIDRGSYYICEKLSHGGACLLEHACGGQRTACGSQLSPSSMWFPGIERGLSGLYLLSHLADPLFLWFVGFLLLLLFSF